MPEKFNNYNNHNFSYLAEKELHEVRFLKTDLEKLRI
jgi:hypothetical protein